MRNRYAQPVCSDSYTEKAVRSEPIDMRKKMYGNQNAACAIDMSNLYAATVILKNAVRSVQIYMRKKARGNLKIFAGLWLKGVGYSRHNRLLRRFELLRRFLNYMVVSG